jgi:hypothetical protein
MLKGFKADFGLGLYTPAISEGSMWWAVLAVAVCESTWSNESAICTTFECDCKHPSADVVYLAVLHSGAEALHASWLH